MTVYEDGVERTPSPEMAMLLRASMFWWPAYIRGTAWLEHLPFLFWMVETRRPRRVVVLDDREGEAFLAVCQAVARLGIDAEVTNVLDPPADVSVDNLSEYTGRHYGAFARLELQDLESAGRLAREESTDLLLLPVGGRKDLLEELRDAWRHTVSPDGVVLLCPAEGDSVAGAGVEAWHRPAGVTLQLGYGRRLSVIVAPSDSAGILPSLRALNESSGVAKIIQEGFARMGCSVRDTLIAERAHVHSQDLERQLRAAEKNAQEHSDCYEKTRAALDVAQVDLAQTKEELERARDEISEKDQSISMLEQFSEDLKAEILKFRLTHKHGRTNTQNNKGKMDRDNEHTNQFDDECATTEQKPAAAPKLLDWHTGSQPRGPADMVERLKDKDRQIYKLEQQLEQAKQEHSIALKERDANIETRFQELADLTQMLEERDKKWGGQSPAQPCRETDLEQVTEYAKQLERRLKLLLASRTWKLGAPIRIVGRAFRRWVLRRPTTRTRLPKPPVAMRR